MAIGQLRKDISKDLIDLGNPENEITGLNKVLRAALFPISINGTIQIDSNPEGIFLLNPSTWEETKSANWTQQNIPGQSDPVFQWISSGAKTLNFEALVTADNSDFLNAQAEAASKKSQPKVVKEETASIASRLFKIQVPPPRNKEVVIYTQALDISSRLNYYRSLLYPKYTKNGNNPGRLKASPPLLVLLAGNGIARLKYGARITSKHDVWVLTDIRIRITKQLPNLAPLEAVVSFSLAQYNIRSFDSNRFR